MSGKRRPDGRRCVLARTASPTLKKIEMETEKAAVLSVASAPTPATRRGATRCVVRLIDLERRARFAQLAS